MMNCWKHQQLFRHIFIFYVNSATWFLRFSFIHCPINIVKKKKNFNIKCVYFKFHCGLSKTLSIIIRLKVEKRKVKKRTWLSSSSINCGLRWTIKELRIIENPLETNNNCSQVDGIVFYGERNTREPKIVYAKEKKGNW